ncbi:MAG: hypothetical protein KAS32_02970 [Candidatus Peribacteraceae bacterium]|nr:hypothetical protein [Candidatus Peribacteraceae bacterium]
MAKEKKDTKLTEAEAEMGRFYESIDQINSTQQQLESKKQQIMPDLRKAMLRVQKLRGKQPKE